MLLSLKNPGDVGLCLVAVGMVTDVIIHRLQKGSYGTSPRFGSSPLDAYKIGGHKDPAQNYKW